MREFTRPDNVKKRIRVDRVMKAFSFLAEASLKKKFNVRCHHTCWRRAGNPPRSVLTSVASGVR